MAGILESGQPLRIGTRRRVVVRRGRFLLQAFVRPLLIVLMTEGVEVPLLRGAICA
jgi:hypothetical protein